MGRLLLLFILVPAVELALLIEVGKWLGTLPTLGIIALTGVVGAYLARLQGLSTLHRAREGMRRGEFPAGYLADGVMILVAGALLMTPGILTDGLGFLLLLPAFRRGVKTFLKERFRRAVEENRIHVHVAGPGFDVGSVRERRERVPFDVELAPENAGERSEPDPGDGEEDARIPKYRIH